MSRRFDRFRVRCGNRQFAVSDVAFHALKARVFLPLVDLVIERAAVVRGRRDMTHVARGDGDFFRQRVERVHRRRVMTGRAVEVGVARKFVPERRRRIALAPGEHHDPVFDLHRRGDLRVEIRFSQRRAELMTGRAVGRRGRDARVRRMTRKTGRVTDGRGLESSLLEPERIAQFGGRFGDEFVRRVALRLICLVTDRAARRGGGGVIRLQPRVDEERAVRAVRSGVPADDLEMLVVRERDLKIRSGGGFAFRRSVENLARVRERMARSARRLRIRVANRADRGLRAFEKLLAMTAQTGFVTRIFRDVGKRVRLSDGFPVFGRKFMTRVALHLVRAVRELGIARRARLTRSALSARQHAFFLRADGKPLARQIGVKAAARQQANERRQQREANFLNFF